MSDDKYIAFDVHQATTVISVLNAARREMNATILPSQTQPLLGFLEGLEGKLHRTLEEGTYPAWLYDLLEGRVAELVVYDPRHNALLKEGNKTDAGDARKLAELLRAGPCVRSITAAGACGACKSWRTVLRYWWKTPRG